MIRKTAEILIIVIWATIIIQAINYSTGRIYLGSKINTLKVRKMVGRSKILKNGVLRIFSGFELLFKFVQLF